MLPVTQMYAAMMETENLLEHVWSTETVTASDIQTWTSMDMYSRVQLKPLTPYPKPNLNPKLVFQP